MQRIRATAGTDKSVQDHTNPKTPSQGVVSETPDFPRMANITIDKTKATALKISIQRSVKAIFFFISVMMPNG
jgi:hypothetical protein